MRRKYTFEADLAAFQPLPDWGSRRLYRIYNSGQELLYIGMTFNLDYRIAQHHRKPWWSEAHSLEIQVYPNETKCRAAEAGAIRAEQPKYNRIRYKGAA